MGNLTLLDQFADPELIKNLSTGQKLRGSLQVTLLGMTVTFVALIILWGLILIMSKILNKSHKCEEQQEEPMIEIKLLEEEELIAVISAAIAASLKTSTNNIVVKNIVKVEDATPIWGKIGRLEQVNGGF